MDANLKGWETLFKQNEKEMQRKWTVRRLKEAGSGGAGLKLQHSRG